MKNTAASCATWPSTSTARSRFAARCVPERERRNVVMSSEHEPVVLDLAPPPREQVGPFLLLGLEKDAGSDEVEANWAKRLIWARKKQFRLALEDVNWAREIINQPEHRVRADAVSLNTDTVDGMLRRLRKRFGAEENCPIGWQAIDVEKTHDEAFSIGTIPDAAEIRANL